MNLKNIVTVDHLKFIALRMTKITYNFGLPECNRVNNDSSNFVNKEFAIKLKTSFKEPHFR